MLHPDQLDGLLFYSGFELFSCTHSKRVRRGNALSAEPFCLLKHQSLTHKILSYFPPTTTAVLSQASQRIQWLPKRYARMLQLNACFTPLIFLDEIIFPSFRFLEHQQSLNIINQAAILPSSVRIIITQ
jgi:hypothetical protein